MLVVIWNRWKQHSMVRTKLLRRTTLMSFLDIAYHNVKHWKVKRFLWTLFYLLWITNHFGTMRSSWCSRYMLQKAEKNVTSLYVSRHWHHKSLWKFYLPLQMMHRIVKLLTTHLSCKHSNSQTSNPEKCLFKHPKCYFVSISNWCFASTFGNNPRWR